MAKYEAKSHVCHDGEDYFPGDGKLLDISDEVAAPLLEAGVIRKPEKPKKAVKTDANESQDGGDGGEGGAE